VTVKTRSTSKQHFAARALDSLSAGGWFRRFPAWDGLLILNYHRIGDPGSSDLDQNLWSATEDDFRAQMTILKRDFDVIGLDRLDETLRRSRGRSVMITFDDGYRDNYTHAFPILKDCGLPATFFIATGFLDHPQVPWWDEIAWMVHSTTVGELPATDWTETPLRIAPETSDAVIRRLLKVYKSLEGQEASCYLTNLAELLKTGRCPVEMNCGLWMTWDMVREMRAAGMTIGGHTVTHPVLANQPLEQQDYEIRECRQRLVAELGEPIDAFSYPVGGSSSFTAATSAALDRYALPRTAVETDIDLPLFRALLALPQWFA
jgi:peptidoglycan/xylan/chitin deacetylase (PgdA/CDA1 family)